MPRKPESVFCRRCGYYHLSPAHSRGEDTSNAENHPQIVAYHKRVLRDYQRWLEKNGKKDPN